MIDILVSQFPGFILGFSFFCMLALCRDAGDFDRLAAWWESVKAAFRNEYRAGRYD